MSKEKEEKVDQKLISVIVPVYKVENYLERCVQSIVDQTYSNLEIILVDDGSPDNCPSLCEKWSRIDRRIHVIHKQNGGLSEARNAGMMFATGEYIAFIDSDDWIAPEMLERLMNAILDNQTDIAACSVKMVWEDNTADQFLTVQINRNLNKQEAQKALLEESLLKQPVWYKLYRYEIIKNLTFEPGKYHEDVFWSYQAIGNANGVSLIDYVGYYYMQRKASIMGEQYSLKRLDVLEAYERRYQYIAKNFPELEPIARRSMLSNCIYHGQMTLKYLDKRERKEVFKHLDMIKDKYQIHRLDYIGEKATHRIWFNMARLSLKMTCMIKNILHVGL